MTDESYNNQESAIKAPFSLRPKIDRGSVPIIFWNLLPFAGVAFLKWEPVSIFIFYALETIIVGLFNVLKLLVVYKYGMPTKPGEEGVSGLGIIPFFIVHYYFFVFIQLSVFFPTTKLYHTGSGPTTLIGTLWHFINNSSTGVALPSFILSCAMLFFTDFLGKGLYKTRSMGEQMFEPYPRIFVQQFVVIVGSFLYAVTGAGVSVLFVFVAFKLYFDLLLKDLSIESLVNLQKMKEEEEKQKAHKA